MSTGRLPVIVGIDFGFTYTKVAVSLPEGGRYSDIRPVNWFSGAALTYTLPTTVTYTTQGQVRIGLDITKATEQGLELFRHFKLKALHPETFGNALCSISEKTRTTARSLLQDFLKCLRTRIQDLLCKEHNWQLFEWEKRHVDFVLSFPSIVGSEGSQIMFETAFEIFSGGHGATHRVLDVLVSEAEAVGVCAVEDLHHTVKSGDTALVLDVGGGTSVSIIAALYPLSNPPAQQDLSMMTFVGRENQREVDTVFLQPVSSDQLGGAHIDIALQSMIEQYLQEVHMRDGGHIPSDWQTMASQFTAHAEYLRSKAEQHTCMVSVGDPKPGDQGLVSPPSLMRRYPGIHFNGRSLTVDGTVFAKLLDDQVYGTSRNRGIISQVIAMRDDLFVRNPSRSVPSTLYNKGPRQDMPDLNPDKLDMVIFSGGVGGSPQVQRKVEQALRAELADDDIGLRKTAAETSFLAPFSDTFQGTQLSVCRGLVYWRMQQLSRGNGDGTEKKNLVFRTWLQSKLGLS